MSNPNDQSKISTKKISNRTGGLEINYSKNTKNNEEQQRIFV